MKKEGLTTGVFDPALVDYREISFSEREYQQRQTQLRNMMRQNDIDVLLITNPDLVCYLHGFRAGWYKANSPMRYPQCYATVISIWSDKIIHFDNPTEESVLAMTSVCKDNRFFSTREPAPNIRFIIDELKQEGWLDRGTNITVGMEYWCYLPNRVVSALFESAFEESGCKVVDCSVMLRALRRIKSPAELAYIEEAVQIAEIGHHVIRDYAKPGMTELALFGEVLRAMMAANGELAALIPIFTALPVRNGTMVPMGHSLPGRRQLAEDTILCADLCGVVHRYHGNQLRGHYIGNPPKSVLEQYRKAAGVYEFISSELCAGMTVGDVNGQLKKYYSAVGLDISKGWALGYELGLSLPPDWVGDFYFNMLDDQYLDRVFEVGMVTNFESLFSTALIETMVWEADGVRLLSKTPPGLSIIDI